MRWKFWRRKPKAPNPGSREAAHLGCTCPVTMNNAGNEKPGGGWKTRPNCPLHGESIHV